MHGTRTVTPRAFARTSAAAFGAVVLGAVLVRPTTAAPAPGRRPNVVLVTVCSLRADRVGAYGYRHPTTPSLDALARDGVLFEQAVSPAGWTRPAVMSLLTGVLPAEHRIETRDPERTLPKDVPTLAERLRARGYRTGGFVSSLDLPPRIGCARGFDVYQGMRTLTPDGIELFSIGPRGVEPRAAPPGDRLAAIEELDARAADWAALDDGAPFFLWLMDFGLHVDNPRTRATIHPASSECLAAFDDRWSTSSMAAEIAGLPVQVEATGIFYDASLLCTDARIGRLLDRLRAAGLYDDTLVVFSADHGEGLFSHEFSHVGAPYDELVRVPLIVKLPGGAAAGRRVAEQVRLVDVVPTVLQEAGLPAPERIDGRPLRGFWTGRPEARDACIATDFPETGHRAVRTHDGWKLMVNRMTGFEAVFRWDRDPDEAENLAGKDRGREGRLHERLLSCAVAAP
jgi:arylsulfatase A-like enzyme